MVKNVDAFYGPRSEPKAARLLESFILESLVICKSDPEVMLVESGDDYVKATAFTPDGESGVELFDDAVDINTMLETYNLALADNGFPQIEAGIGLAAFQETIPDDELPDPDDVSIGEPQSGYDVAYDSEELALRLAEHGQRRRVRSDRDGRDLLPGSSPISTKRNGFWTRTCAKSISKAKISPCITATSSWTKQQKYTRRVG
ncbi:MAG: hypothetical protein M0C28_18565 [Candidatus Moduliflexus flocculans]|nr:hypothetical protein [Candidatus Moduliflexus flocculans]